MAEGRWKYKTRPDQEEKERILASFQNGKQAKQARGEWHAGQHWYETKLVDGKLHFDEERMRIVRHMLRLRKLVNVTGKMREHPWSFKQICDYLNGANDLPNPDGSRGRVFPSPNAELLWNYDTVRRIIRNHDKRMDDIRKYIQTGKFPEQQKERIMDSESNRVSESNLVLLQPSESRLVAFEQKVKELYEHANLKGKYLILDELDDVLLCLKEEMALRR